MAKINKDKIKKAFSSRQFKMGAFQTGITVIVIVLVVLLNLLVGKLNFMVDLSSDKKYSLTEDSKKVVNDLKDNVTLYHMIQGNQSSSSGDIIKKVLDQYSGVGGKVSLIQKDPVQYPKFASEYTEDEISNGDVIVVNDVTKKAKHVSINDMVPADYDYSTGETSYKILDVEGQVTAAIQAVTSQNTKKLYCSKGHDEQALSASLTDILTKSNMTVETTRTDVKGGIPKDCDLLLVNGPMYDFSDEDTKNILSYLENGGKAMFFLNAAASDSSLPNYYKVLKSYGLKISNGIVYEAADHYVSEYPMAIVATVDSHDITADVAADKQTISANTKGLTIENDVRSTLTASPLLSSSEGAFARVSSTDTSKNKVKGDIDGPFTLGVAITDEYKDKMAKLVVFGSYYVADNSFIADNAYGNRSIILNSISWLNGQETSTLVIPQRSLTDTQVEVSETESGFWSVLLVIVLPLAIMGFGFFIWYRRRKS